MSARRVLAVLEGRDSDEAVLAHALDVVGGSGGYLTVVVLVSRPFPCINTGPLCGPTVSEAELWASAEETLARVVTRVPSSVPLLTAVECGRTKAVVLRRVESAAHDLVVIRRRWFRMGALPVPLVAVAQPRCKGFSAVGQADFA